MSAERKTRLAPLLAVAFAFGCAPAIQWVRIPAGSFDMGSPEPNESPIHRVTLPAFEMAKTAVTNRQYRACVKAGKCAPPVVKKEGFAGDEQPVVGVDWSQAKAFCDWIGASLPSEAQWEYAARSAGKYPKYPWGEAPYDCERAAGENCARTTAPVCSKPKGNTDQGLCDMAGNAWQWTADWYHPSYDGAPADGSAWVEPPGVFRVFRGGSWYGGTAFGAVHRNGLGPDYRDEVLTFRPVRPARD